MNAKPFFENLKNHAWNTFQYFFGAIINQVFPSRKFAIMDIVAAL